MTSSGTATFIMDFTELAEEAFERAGQVIRTGYDLRTARRSMNLLTIEWINRGLNMFTMEEGTIALVVGQSEYDLLADTVDLMEVMIRTNSGSVLSQSDMPANRISVSNYAAIPNKLLSGKPNQVLVRRLASVPKVVVWPVPDRAGYFLQYWRLRRIQDAGDGVETPDVSFRFYPALVAGLAYFIAQKLPESANRLPFLKQEYEEQYRMAAEEDREKASVRFIPRICR